MKITTVAASVLSLAFIAGCGKNDRPATTGSSATPQSQSVPSSANAGKTERNPVQGQIDPKEGAQNKDFKTNGK